MNMKLQEDGKCVLRALRRVVSSRLECSGNSCLKERQTKNI